MRRILFVSNVHRRFIDLDEEILRQRYDVQAVYVQKAQPRLFFDFWRQIKPVDLVVAWFASWHSFPAFLMARVRRVPRLLITGGYDVANEPEIGYGLRRGGLPKIISGQVFRLADRTLAFSGYSYREALANTPLKGDKIGFIDLGLPDVPVFAQPCEKEPIVITIGAIDSMSVQRKGIRLFVEAARLLPHIPFFVVGKAYDHSIDELRQIASPNVEFTGFLKDEDLWALQRRAKVYVQASKHEGFGLSLAESMLARCIPVVTRRGALPDVAGPTGVYADDDSPNLLASSIQQALDTNPELGEAARAYILKQFPLDKRAQALYAEIDRLMSRDNARG